MQGYSSFFSSSNIGTNDWLSNKVSVSSSYPTLQEFLRAEWGICKVATDGCNTGGIENGQLMGMTRMSCWPNHQPTWSCREYREDNQHISVSSSYSTLQEFLRAEWDICKVATDGCNTGGIENGQLVGMTRMSCWQNHQPTWSCREYREDNQPDPGTPSCPEYWDPVCAQPPMWECPEGLSCATVMPPLETYGNACEAWVAGAKIMYEWVCRGDNDSRPPRPDEPFACTKDVRICPDGSSVGREWPNCEFAACPQEPMICTDDAKQCPDGSFVVRTWPNCEFAACPREISPNPWVHNTMVNRARLERYHNTYWSRYRSIIMQAPRENLIRAVWLIQNEIENTRQSNLSARQQESRITALTFFDELFSDALVR